MIPVPAFFPRPLLSLFDPFAAPSRPLTALNFPRPPEIFYGHFWAKGPWRRPPGNPEFLPHRQLLCHALQCRLPTILRCLAIVLHLRGRFFRPNPISWCDVLWPPTRETTDTGPVLFQQVSWHHSPVPWLAQHSFLAIFPPERLHPPYCQCLTQVFPVIFCHQFGPQHFHFWGPNPHDRNAFEKSLICAAHKFRLWSSQLSCWLLHLLCYSDPIYHM
jgi:hypothetical protein